MLVSGRIAASRFGVARNVRQIRALSSNIRPISAESGSSNSNQFFLPLVAAGMLVFGVSSSTEWPRTNLDAATGTISLDSTLPVEESTEAEDDKTTKVINWSGTHSVNVSNEHYWEPETVEEVEAIVKECHLKGQAVRPLGSSLSPNGIALHSEGMISMAYLDKVLDIDTKNKTVTVQAGITVNGVIAALRPHGLTLPNLASIAEQQMGGFTQVGAHGTGRLVAPVDHYVTKLKLVTPGMGTMELTKEDGELFELAKVGLGCLGVVVEVTMECIPAHRLVEHTFVLTRKEAKEQLDTLLKLHKHMRYMWVPYTDVVVVVTNDPEDQVPKSTPRKASSASSPEEKSRPLTDFLAKISKNSSKPYTEENMKGMAFGELRDAMLAVDPLNVDHVKQCNQAEADFWKHNEGYQTQNSDKLLQFDCGGQQWVFEVCFATGTQEENNGNDMEFMEKLLAGIEENKIPSHSPIEQRWSASSSSKMSPAHGPPEGMFTWVGIINYLPSDDETQRKEIADQFTGRYCDLVRSIGKPMQSVSHWAKLEKPQTVRQAVALRILMEDRYPLEQFNKARGKMDPKNILSSPLINIALGNPEF